MRTPNLKPSLLVRLATPGKFSPAVYQTDRGTYLIQGWKVDDKERQQTEDFRADHEEVVEIPPELITKIKNL